MDQDQSDQPNIDQPADQDQASDPWAGIFGADQVDTSVLDKLNSQTDGDEQDELEE